MFAEHLPRLRDDVAGDEVAVAVDRHAARDEEEVAGADGVGVVADRLRPARRRGLLAPFAHAPARMALSVVRGLIASGSMRRSSSAGLPGGERALERRRELVRALDRLAVRAECARVAPRSPG